MTNFPFNARDALWSKIKQHATYGSAYTYTPAAVARDLAQLAQDTEIRNPTPTGVALRVWDRLFNDALLDVDADSCQVREALIPLFEEILTTTWANGFDDGMAAARDRVLEVLDDD